MSYDLWFWRQSRKCRHRPATVVQRVCEGGELQGVAKLDFNAIRDRFAEVFPGMKDSLYDAGTHYFNLDVYPPFAFQIISSPPETEEVTEMLNSIIDIAAEFDCSLYDPQTGERYS